MGQSRDFGRREFLRRSALTGAALGLGGSLWGIRPARGQEAANERVNLGLIGVGGMGGGHLGSLVKRPEFQITAICEIDKTRLAKAVDRVTKDAGSTPFGTADYHELLARPDVDAVVIATPDHWHATQAIHAVRAGKDVYCEKPLSHDIEEGQILVAEARRLGRVVQVGTQQRSNRNFQRACEIVRSGQLGTLQSAHAWKAPRALRVTDQGAINNRAALDNLDWDRWLGPSPEIPFDQNRAHYAWRYFWDQGGGLMTDWGVHMLDIVMWALRNPTLLAVESTGTQAQDSPMEVPYEQLARYEFSDLSVEWQQGGNMQIDPEGVMKDHGIAFIGSDAQLYVTRGSMPRVYPETFEVKEIPEDIQIPKFSDHYADWLDAIKKRDRLPLADVAEGHFSSTIANCGNIAYRVGRRLEWDAEAERFNDTALGELLAEHHARAPYTID